MKRWKLYFAYAHLPPHLQAVSKPFHDLAVAIMDRQPFDKGLAAAVTKVSLDGGHDIGQAEEAQREIENAINSAWFSIGPRAFDAIDSLLRAKDCAVRAHIPDPPEPDAG